jgi:poly-gamma-glutamate synthesis protein (capsule biosynthesis protein)
MPSDRTRYSSYGGHGSDRGPSASGGRHRQAGGRDTGPRRPRRRGRADLVVWLVLILVAVGTIIAAFAIPLPGQKDDAGAAPRASSTATPSPTTSGSTSPSPSPSSTALPPVTVVDGGDVMGASGVDSAIRAHGADYVMAGIKPTLQVADFAFFNLESPLSSLGSPQTWKDVYFRGNPKLAAAIAKAGVDVVGMANNHCLDYKASALLDTIKRMNRLGVQVVGAGANAAAAYKFAFITRKGVTIAFMQWTDIMPPGYAATSTGAGAAVGPQWAPYDSMAKFKAAIRAAKKKADYVVVSLHWGVEGQHYPIGTQVQEGRAAIDAGADMVMSHHPHFLQGAEAYHGGLIMYSFGDLIFPPRSLPAGQTVLMTTTLTKTSLVASMEPVILNSQGVPRIAHGSMAASILTQMKTFSRSRGTYVKLDLAHNRALISVKRS